MYKLYKYTTLHRNSDQTRSSASCNLQLRGFGFCGFRWANMQPNHPVRTQNSQPELDCV